MVVANVAFVRSSMLWLLLPCLGLLFLALTTASMLLRSGGPILPALALITAGNWVIALIVAVVLPFLWPAMVFTVLIPVVLATPYLRRDQLLVVIVVAGVITAVVTSVGVFRPGQGVLPDLDDGIAHLAVMGALVAHIPPVGLIIWQNNRMQHESLQRAHDLNLRLRESQDELAASRRRVVQAGDLERRRIERDLHDGAQQRLVTLGVRLRLLETQTTHLPDVNDSVHALLDELTAAIADVRELSKGIYPPLLQSEGLVHALNDIGRRSTVPVKLDLAEVGRLHPSVETALYFTALEAVTNVAKHAPNALVQMSLVDDGLLLCLSIVDDGPGFELNASAHSEGVNRMDDRVSAVGGSLLVASEPGVGTSVTAMVPRGKAPSAESKTAAPAVHAGWS